MIEWSVKSFKSFFLLIDSCVGMESQPHENNNDPAHTVINEYKQD